MVIGVKVIVGLTEWAPRLWYLSLWAFGACTIHDECYTPTCHVLMLQKVGYEYGDRFQMVLRARVIVGFNAVTPHARVPGHVQVDPYMLSDVHPRGGFQCFGKLKWVELNDIRWFYGPGVP